MKAILVVDVPTESLENIIASVNICEQREGYNIILKRMGKMNLKPMPQKKEETFAYWIAQGDPESYINGWNDCIDELLGETE